MLVGGKAMAPTPTPSLPGEVMPPVGYSPSWLVIGIALLTLVALFYLFVWWFTRQPRVVAAPASEPTRYDAAVYLQQVDAVAHAVQQGALSQREGYGELSRIVRAAVRESTGIPTDRMTLTDLRNTPLAHTSKAVSFFYPGVFGQQPSYDYDHALVLAREVLHGWN